MQERHWTNLIESLRQSQCVLVLGSELIGKGRAPIADPSSRALPTTLNSAFAEYLLTQMANETPRGVTSRGLAAIAQHYEDAHGFGPSSLRAEATKFYRDQAVDAYESHKILATLPFKLIVTTAHSHYFERLLGEAKKTPVSHRYHFRGDGRDNPDLPQPVSAKEPIVYHLFGDFQTPASMVLSENDLLDFLIAIVGAKPALPDGLVRALQRLGQSFLFIGLGLRDFYLRVLLKVLVRALALNRSGSSFVLEPLEEFSGTDREQTVLYYHRGTRIEFLDLDADAFVLELNERFTRAGGAAAEAATGPKPRVFVCHAHEDAALASRLASSFTAGNLDPWLDQRSLGGGDQWETTIESELRDTDFAVVLHSPALQAKTDSFVNKEIRLAIDRGLRVRGTFVIPIRTDALADAGRVEELSPFQEMPLRAASYDADVTAIVSRITREYQVRLKQ